MPQYITEDTEVGVFIELRRSIEAVNLLVSIRSSKAHEEGPASYINAKSAEHDGEREDCDIEDDEWHEFAMANNTVTIADMTGYPGKKNLESGDAIPHAVSGIAYSRTPAIPFQIGGVEIREPEHNIRQRIQHEPGVAMEKGKKKMKIETPSDTDSDSDDDMVVPVFRTAADISGKGKRPIWEHNDRRRTTATGQYNGAAQGQDMVNDPRIPDLLEREEPPQRTAHQRSGVESEISDVHIQRGETFVGGGSKTNMNSTTSASTTLFGKVFPLIGTNFIVVQTCRISERHHHQSGRAHVVDFTDTTRHLVASQCNNQTTVPAAEGRMTSQDRVLLIIGSWVRDQYKRWVFEPDISNQLQHYIRLRTGMTFRELLTAVRERLQVTTKGVTLKLSYQYPEWVSFDDPELGLPVYITDDIEVRGFIEMRRAIEEVNLFVSLVCPTGGLQIARETADMNPTMAARVNPTMDESWHDFAISETPLTLPQTEANANKRVIEVPDDSISRQEGGMDYTGRRAIPFTTGGIEIREPTQAIRLRSPPIAATDKGKNKMRSEASSDTDSDDDMVVPVLRTSVDIGEGANMPVRRQNPALLGRDAPPVFNARLVSGEVYALDKSTLQREYDEIGIPCPHALAASSKVGFPSDAMVAPAYRVPTWRQGFAGKIYPVPSVGGSQVGSSTTAELLPPAVRRPSGRPRKVRIKSRGEFKKSGQSSSNRRCARCGRTGHNRASCRNPI
ncbi:unnamed protein product [Brassica napus]|uniref:(rape) hypothetical protein n=1 Tax=Brassica napus TaxID=3708 RepID=A0A816ZP13_BRANA|nr:unnamed protein product [Brassica napus]